MRLLLISSSNVHGYGYLDHPEDSQNGLKMLQLMGEMRDPRGPQTGNMRIVRGGSWVTADVTMLRCAYRHKVPPDTYAYSIGFRIVCE